MIIFDKISCLWRFKDWFGD